MSYLFYPFITVAIGTVIGSICYANVVIKGSRNKTGSEFIDLSNSQDLFNDYNTKLSAFKATNSSPPITEVPFSTEGLNLEVVNRFSPDLFYEVDRIEFCD